MIGSHAFHNKSIGISLRTTVVTRVPTENVFRVVSMMYTLAGIDTCTEGTTRRQRYRNNKGVRGSP